MSWRARASRSLAEVRFVYCDKAASSAGLRSWLGANMADLEQLNPGLPLLDRPYRDTKEPRINVRYDYGVEEEHPVSGLSDAQVELIVKTMVEKGYTQRQSPRQTGRTPDKDIVDGKNPEAPHWWPVSH